MPEFEKGDVVQLKSGGPPITVSDIEEEDVWCEWFDKKGVHHKEVFDVAMLIKVEKDPE